MINIYGDVHTYFIVLNCYIIYLVNCIYLGILCFIHDGSSKELFTTDQQPAIIDSQPFTSCVIQTKTEILDGDFNQNVDNHGI